MASPDARDCTPRQVASDSADFMTATLARHIAGVSQLNHAGLSWNQQQPPGAGGAEAGAAGQPAPDRPATGTQPTSVERDSLSSLLQVIVALRFWGGGEEGGPRPICLARLHAWPSPYVHPGGRMRGLSPPACIASRASRHHEAPQRAARCCRQHLLSPRNRLRNRLRVP